MKISLYLDRALASWMLGGRVGQVATAAARRPIGAQRDPPDGRGLGPLPTASATPSQPPSAIAQWSIQSPPTS